MATDASARRLATRYAVLAFLTHAAFVTASLVPGWRAEPLASGDAVTYLEAGQALIDHGTFSREAAAPFLWEPYRTPGYPALIAGSLVLTGGYEAVLYVACLTAAAAAFVCVWMAVQWAGARAGHAAGWLAALLPNSLGLAGLMLTDALAGHLTVVWLALLFLALTRRSAGWLLACAVLLAVLQSLKPTFNLGWVIVLAAFWAVHDGRRQLRIAAILVTASFAVPVYFAYRNLESHGVFAPTLLGVETARRYLQAGSIHAETGLPYAEVVRRIDQEDRLASARMIARSDYGRMYLARREALLDFLRARPIHATGLMATEATRQLLAPQHFPLVIFLASRPWIVRASGTAISVLLLAAAAAGALNAVRSGNRAWAVLAAVCLAYFLATGSVSRFVGARLRFPADMVLLPLAAVGIADVTRRSPDPR